MTGTNSKKLGNADRVTGVGAHDEPTGEIARKLRAFYDSVQEQTIPDRFLSLLEQLDEAEKNAGNTEQK